jgi:carbonic anhydrase
MVCKIYWPNPYLPEEMHQMIFNKKMFAILPALLLLLSACAPAVTPAPVATGTPAPVHWTYEGEEGPAHWADLSPTFAACSAGKEQSPVDLTKADEKDLTNIVFHYQPSKVNIINNGHTIQVNYDAGSYIEVDGVRYDLLQFHFHAPSEHSINGKLAEAEVHFVHKNADGKLAVVGVLIEKGVSDNGAVQSFWNNLPAASGPVQTLDAQVNSNDFLPAVQTTYRYDGSLTTPPCTEGVKWMVMTEPIVFSEAQLANYTKLFEGTNRPVQELNGRPEVEDTSP